MGSPFIHQTQAALVRISTTSTHLSGRLARYQVSVQAHHVLIVVVTLVAGFMRLHRLGEWSFWQDELSTVMGIADGFNLNTIGEPVSQLLIQLVMSHLGPSEWSARLVPAIIGTLTIPVLFVVTRRLFGSGVAVVSSLLLAVSPWHLYWSQNARFYSLLLLLYTLALLSLYHGIENDRPRYLIISVLLFGLAASERLLALFYVPIALAYVLLLASLPFEKPDGFRLRNVMLLFLPVISVGLYLAFPYLKHLDLWFSSGFGRMNNNPVWLVLGTFYYIRPSIVCMAVVGTVYFMFKKQRSALFLSLGVLVPLLGIVALAPFHYTANRYLFITLPCWILLAGAATVAIFQEVKGHARVLVLGVLLFLLVDPLGEDFLYYNFNHGNRANWRAALELIQEHKSDGESVVTTTPAVARYYLKESTVPMRHVDPAALEAGHQRVWLVEDMTARALYPDLFRWVDQNARPVATFDVVVHGRNFIMRVYYFAAARARESGEGEDRDR